MLETRRYEEPSDFCVFHFFDDNLMRLRQNILIFVLFINASSVISQTHDVHVQIAQAAIDQVGVTTHYAPGYTRIPYPMGDIQLESGVCSDVIIRAFRSIRVDLQKNVHEDMKNHFHVYPNIWGMKKPDSNIDHRRVPNLMKYFQRQGKEMPLHSEYKPGDIVAWRLKNGLHHIGIVSLKKVPHQTRYYIVHNIGAGAQEEDVLYSYTVIGHYRW